MTSNEFYALGFDTQLNLLEQKGKFLFAESNARETHMYYKFKKFVIDYRKWENSDEASILILEVKPAREVLEQADKIKETKKSLAAFRKLSASGQRKILDELKRNNV